MDSLLSFPVGLFHPLQHAGLSRRSPPSSGSNPDGDIDDAATSLPGEYLVAYKSCGREAPMREP